MSRTYACPCGMTEIERRPLVVQVLRGEPQFTNRGFLCTTCRHLVGPVPASAEGVRRG